jgi:arginine exporter protein ArgO
MSGENVSKLVARISAIAIGILVFLFGLLLLSTSVFGVLKVHNDIEFSLEGFLIVAGVLFLFFSTLTRVLEPWSSQKLH